jgi:Ca2+:H+ antiporter
VAWVVLVGTFAFGSSLVLAGLAGVALITTVFAAVYHAEVVAHKVGEPFGTIVLAIAVTVIEAALIVSMMMAPGPDKESLARDTVFAAVMIVCNGIVGLCLLLGGARHREQGFQVAGANAALAVLAALTILTLVLPNYTVSTPGPQFSKPQLIYAGIASLVLYGSFIFVQTVRHRDYFLPIDDITHESEPPSTRATILSLVLLIVCLVAVVLLAKSLTPALEAGVAWLNAPRAFVGVVIATLVLLPEGTAAVRAAQANRLQTSLNLALGSSLATIGLTIPVVGVVALALDQPLVLGLEPKELVLLALTLMLGVFTLGTGRTTVLQGIVHLVTFATFLFLSLVP